MRLSVVAAMSENRVIGRGAEIPWTLRDEQQAVKKLTMGHCLIMGRKTWESIGRPLPGRTSIVITGQSEYLAGRDDVRVAPTFEAAVAEAERTGDDEAFVFGGEAVYRDALPRAHRLYLTHVHAQVEGDVTFPEFDESEWRVESEETHTADARNEYAFTIRRYERV